MAPRTPRQKVAGCYERDWINSLLKIELVLEHASALKH